MANSKLKCRYCGEYHPRETMIKAPLGYFCSIEHARLHGEAKRDKAKAKQARAEHRKRKQEVQYKKSALQEAQTVFNRYVRLRDRYYGQKGCICCPDRLLDWNNPQAVDAGHFLNVGGHGGLRFNLWNVHSQSSYCNRYRGGDSGLYRDNLILKIGLSKVENLEASKARGKFTNEYLARIKRIFAKKCRIMEKRLGL